jgi:hypothetical protein
MGVRFSHAGPYIMQTYRKHPTFNVKENVILFNKITSDSFIGDIVNEDEIEGRQYWVFYSYNRPKSRLLMAKDSYTITKAKK